MQKHKIFQNILQDIGGGPTLVPVQLCCTAVYTRDETGGNRRGNRRGVRHIFLKTPLFLVLLLLGNLVFPKQYQTFILKQNSAFI